ncbi:MAG: hypothetical protein QNJ54_25965 [Prochloraceae cyanobacterium]|nr:hypothetical protein [Prochloraceae cyanobacterium]
MTIPVTEKTTTAIDELIDKTQASAKLLISNASFALEVDREDLKTNANIVELSSTSSEVLLDKQAIRESIANLLSENRGTIVHINYIVREIYGQLPTEKSARVKKELIKVLSRGEEEGQWSKVPDSPGGWTIDLKELPNPISKDGETERTGDGERVKDHKSNLSCQKVVTQSPSHPVSPSQEVGETERIRDSQIGKSNKIQKTLKKTYLNLTDAVTGCMRSHPQQPMTIDSVYEWILENAKVRMLNLRTARKSVARILGQGCDNKGWTRVGVGVYQYSGVSRDLSSTPEKSLAIMVPSVSTSLLNTVEAEDSNLAHHEQMLNDEGQSLGNFGNKFKNLPNCEKLRKYKSLKEIVAACLKELKIPAKASDIIDLLYPDGLKSETRKLVYQSISSTLNTYCGNNWTRVKPGFYKVIGNEQ